MATAAERRAYARKLNSISKQHQRLERETLQASIRLLKSVRDQIAGQLTGTEFNEFRIAEQTAQLNAIINEYDAQLRSLANGAVRQSFDLGERSVIEPLQELDLTGVFFRPSEAQVDILAQFSADLVGGVTEDMRRKVNRTIRMSALGGQSSLDAMRQITKDLGIPTRRTARAKGVSYEAERILRTETTRAYNLANFSQQEKVAQDIPDMQKRWMATGDGRTRQTHLNAHGQTVDVDKPFKIGGAELMYPGDPTAPPSETINCRCRTISIPPDFDAVELPVDKQVEKEKAERKPEPIKPKGKAKPKPKPKPEPEPAPVVPKLTPKPDTSVPNFSSYDEAAAWIEENSPIFGLEDLAVRRYTNEFPPDYVELNRLLREGQLEGDPAMANWANALERGLNQLPRYEGTVYRGLNFGDVANRDAFLNSIRELQGTDMPAIFPSFSSTSPSQKAAQQFTRKKDGVMLEIKSINGRTISPYAGEFAEEQEVLFNRNSTLKVLEVREEEGLTRVIMEQIE